MTAGDITDGATGTSIAGITVIIRGLGEAGIDQARLQIEAGENIDFSRPLYLHDGKDRLTTSQKRIISIKGEVSVCDVRWIFVLTRFTDATTLNNKLSHTTIYFQRRTVGARG